LKTFIGRLAHHRLYIALTEVDDDGATAAAAADILL